MSYPSRGWRINQEDAERIQEAARAFSKAVSEALNALTDGIAAFYNAIGMTAQEAATSLEDVWKAIEAEEERTEKHTSPCPYRPSRRPEKAVKAVYQFQPINTKRPHARSTIRQRGNRRKG